MLSFFRRDDQPGLEHVLVESLTMLGDARYSFDLATIALLTGTGRTEVGDDIRATDERINQAERSLRSELVAHVQGQGSADIGSVLGFILLLKKIERIGDQAKNILELVEQGVSLDRAADVDRMMLQRQQISDFYAEAAGFLAAPDDNPVALDEFGRRATDVEEGLGDEIDRLVLSDRPGHEAVPLAIYDRYLKRIVANLVGIARTAAEPVQATD